MHMNTSKLLRSVHNGFLRPPLTCGAGSTLGGVADAMLLARVHRAWLIDAQGQAVGVVSLTDVLRAIHAAESKLTAAA